MKFIDSINNQELIFSVEVVPPSIEENINLLFETLDPLVELGVQFVNITYHANHIVGYIGHNGTRVPIFQKKKPGTTGIAGRILRRYGEKVEPVPHVICAEFDQNNIESILVDLSYMGVTNVLALRGDPPKDEFGKQLPYPDLPNGYQHADELIRQIDNLRKGKYLGFKNGIPLDVCIGAACYPEKHIDSTNWVDEFYWTRVKEGSGADYLITQMFFDNQIYYDFIEEARKEEVSIPIIPGLWPISYYSSLKSIPEKFGSSIPKKLAKNVEKYRNNPEDIKKVGVEWCIKQCEDLLDNGVKNIHLYVNGGSKVKEVLEGLKQVSFAQYF